nr:hypothetical protein [Tanacetum cinerariifolium]
MATLIISISSDSLEESVGSFTSRVVMFGTIPTVTPIVLEVAVVVASPAGVLDLDIHTTSEASDDSSGSDSLVSHSSLDSHEVVVARWRGKEIPLGQPYYTHPNGVLRMLTARKRVHPFLARIPSNHSPSSVTTVAPVDVPGPATRDTPVPTADHLPTPSPSAGPSQKRCRSLATSVPITTPTPRALSFARVDLLLPHKRIRGPLVALSLEDSSEESMEAGSGEDIDSNVMANIEAYIVVEVAETDEIRAETRGGKWVGSGRFGSWVKWVLGRTVHGSNRLPPLAETEDGFEGDDEVEDETESITRGTMEIRLIELRFLFGGLLTLRRSRRLERSEHWLMREMTMLRERVSMLEGRNMRLRGDLAEERELADSIGRCLSYVQEELRQIRSSCYYGMMDFRRLETFAMRRLGYRP